MADLKRDVEIILAIKDRTSEGIDSALKNVERLKKELNATTKSFKNMTKAGSGQLNESLRTAAALARKAAKEVDGTGKSARRTAESAKGMMAQFAKFQVLVRKINSAKFAVVGIASAFTLVAKNVSGLNLEMEALRRRFAIIDSTNLAGLANSFDFVAEEARRLGLPIRELATGFSGFILALQGTQLEGRRGVETFSRLTAAFTALGLSQQDVNGSLRALSQIASKGVVSSEELRQQLGERLPGAFSIAARSLGISTRELNKQLALGTIESADFLEKFSIEIEKTFGSQLQDAIDSPRASFARLNNEFVLLMDGLGGFINPVLKPLADAFTELTSILNSLGGLLVRVTKRFLELEVIASLGGKIVKGWEPLVEALSNIDTALDSVLAKQKFSGKNLTVATENLLVDIKAATNNFSTEFKGAFKNFQLALTAKQLTKDQFANFRQELEIEIRNGTTALVNFRDRLEKVNDKFGKVVKRNARNLPPEVVEAKNLVKAQEEALQSMIDLQNQLNQQDVVELRDRFEISPGNLEKINEFFSKQKELNVELTKTSLEQLELRRKENLATLDKIFTAEDANGLQITQRNARYNELKALLDENYQAEKKAILDKQAKDELRANERTLSSARKNSKERRRIAQEESALIRQLGDLKIQQAELEVARGNVEQIASIEKLRAEKELNAIYQKRDEIIAETIALVANGDLAAAAGLTEQLNILYQILEVQKLINDLKIKGAIQEQKSAEKTVGEEAFQNETNQLFGAGLFDLGDFDDEQEKRNAKLRETQEIIGVGINGAVDGLSGGLQGLIDGTQSFGQAFQKVGQQMLAMITRLIAQMIVLAIVRRIAGLKGGGEVTDSGFTGIGETGGPLREVANGGLISGNPNIRSSNIALGSRTSNLFGNDLLSALNDDDMLVRANANGVTDVRNGGLMPGTPNKRDDKLSVAEVGQYVIPGNKVSKYGPGFFHYLDALAQSGRRIQARAIGGEIMKYANGGGVGRTEPVFLSSGEYVMSKQATQFFGTKFFERIRKGIASPDDLKLDLDSIVNGGRVPGQRNNRDDRLAVGPRDGFVIPNSKVSKFGEKFFEDINTFSLTSRRFANGGMLGKPSYNFTGGVTARMSPTVSSMNPVDVNSALGDRTGGAAQPDLSLTIVDDNRNERLQAVEEDRTIVSVKNARRRGELLTL